MKKIEAPTLEEAYTKASQVLGCSVSKLKCEVVQHPSSGVLGFMKKNAIIVADCDKTQPSSKSEVKLTKNNSSSNKPLASNIKSSVPEKTIQQTLPTTPKKELAEISVTLAKEENDILNNFFETDSEEIDEPVVYDELALLIENQLKELLDLSCFDIDVVEVDVRDNTALIFIDGEDAALLIGKEGYRYNALSYMIFNWLHSKYELFIKLEIAEFITKQTEMIRAYIQPVIESVKKDGRGKTRFLDGILVHIALEQLREIFPDKYVAVKSSKDGKKFVVINEFNTKKNV